MTREDGSLAFRSEPQQKGFNRPLQIGRVNPAESLEKAQLSRVDLGRGDVIVAAADGLFDNLFDDEIAALVTSLHDAHLPGSTAKETADATVAAFSSAQVTPFALAIKAARFRHADALLLSLQFGVGGVKNLSENDVWSGKASDERPKARR